MERPTVLLALSENADEYTAALTRAGFDVTDDTAGIGLRIAQGDAPELAVLDCDLPEAEAQQLYDALHGDPAVPTLLLFGAEIPEFATSNTNVTFDEYGIKPTPAEALVYRLHALLIRGGRTMPGEGGTWTPSTSEDGTAIGEGHVVSVFAPKGGVGKTTVAVNVAVALREQTRSRVLLFDADVGVGNVTSVLAAPYRLGLSDLSDSDPSEWTDAAFEQATSTHAASGIRVLTWGQDPGESERVTVDLMLAALRWARAHHAYVVVDTHPGYDDRTMAMLTVANEILLVVTPEVGAIRNSSQFLDLAREVGLRDMVRVVVNRANHGVRLPDIEQTLGLKVSATVVSNGPKAVIAANEGLPVVTKYPKDRIATDLHDVARLVTAGNAPAEEVSASRRSWWSSLVSKASSA